MQRDTGAQAWKNLREGSIETQTHTHARAQIPTDRHAGTGVGRELSNPPQSRAPPRGPAAQGATSYQASRRLQIRSALSPPAGSGDPPPLPSAPAPLRAAAPLREGPGLPPAARRVNLCLPPGRFGPPAPGRAVPPWGPREPKTQACPGAVRSSRTQRPACGVRVPVPMWPGRTSARVGRSFSPAFPFPVPRPTLPRLARALSLPGMAY